MLCLSAISRFGPTSGVVINLFALDACRLNWPPLLDSVFSKVFCQWMTDSRIAERFHDRPVFSLATTSLGVALGAHSPDQMST